MNQEQGPSKGVFPSSLNEKGSTTFGITTEKPPETNTHFNDERKIAFEPSEKTVPPERPKIWDREPPAKQPLIERLVNNLALRIALAGAGVYGAGYAVNEVYQNIPAVRQNTDNALERFGLKVVVPPTFDNKAEENVLGKNNSFYVTPEEYKEKGPPTVEGNHVNVPFFIRFNDGKEHTIYFKPGYIGPGSWEISGDIKGGEILVPFPEDGEIDIGGGNWGFADIYKPGFRFSDWSISDVSGVDGKGRRFGVHIETGALQTSQDLNLQQEIYTVPGTDIKRLTNSSKGPIKGFASIGTLLDDKPVAIFSTIVMDTPKVKGAPAGVDTRIATTPTGQAYVLK